MKIKSIVAGAAGLALLGLQGTASAGTIVGGSSMLTGAHVTQLEGWLGEGPLELTNIYTKTSGDTSTDWHTNVDGQGRTFSILEMVASNAQGQTITHIVGGYNPQSWRSTGPVWNDTPNDADRTAFIFNLTTDIVQRQCLTTDAATCGRDGSDEGYRQTRNDATRGPVFGGGFDLTVNSSTLNSGYSWNWSYDVAAGTGGGTAGGGNVNGIDGNPSLWQWTSVGALETFTIAEDTSDPGTTEVPAPGILAIFGIGLLGLGFARRKRAA